MHACIGIISASTCNEEEQTDEDHPRPGRRAQRTRTPAAEIPRPLRGQAAGHPDPAHARAARQAARPGAAAARSEEHTSELQSRENLVCRLLLEKKKQTIAL